MHFYQNETIWRTKRKFSGKKLLGKKKAKKGQQKRWTWSDEKVKCLVDALLDYKVKCEFTNVDFKCAAT